VVLWRVRAIILEREKEAAWVANLHSAASLKTLGARA
jgi:hypothetical protein